LDEFDLNVMNMYGMM